MFSPFSFSAQELGVSSYESFPGVTPESVKARQEAQVIPADRDGARQESLSWLSNDLQLVTSEKSTPQAIPENETEEQPPIESGESAAGISGSQAVMADDMAAVSETDSFFSRTYHLLKLQVEKAWNFATGKGVKVAVIDSGIDLSHPDLAPNIFTNPNEIEGNGIDDDQNGFIDDVHGWDFVNSDNNPNDDQGHGTHVSGIIGAIKDVTAGLAGIAREATLIPIKVLNAANIAVGNVLAAIRYAVDLGARVINLSLGGKGLFSLGADRLEEIRSVLRYARDHGAVIVAAAGNGEGAVTKLPADVNNYIYAGFSDTIAVGASDSNDQHSGFTNIGSELDFTAPGVRVFSTYLRSKKAEGVDTISGSSMAAPMVSGIAALLLEQDPTLNFDGVYRRLKYSSVDLGSMGRDNIFGYGRVDALRALEYDYYEDGRVKTHWLSVPDEEGVVRYDYASSGHVTAGLYSDGRRFAQQVSEQGILQQKQIYRANGIVERTEIYDAEGEWQEIDFADGTRILRGVVEEPLRQNLELKADFELIFHTHFSSGLSWSSDDSKILLRIIQNESLYLELHNPDFVRNLSRLHQLHERLEDRNEEFAAIENIPTCDRWLGEPRYVSAMISAVRPIEFNLENLNYRPRASGVPLEATHPDILALDRRVAMDRISFERLYGVSVSDQQLSNEVYLQRLNAVLKKADALPQSPLMPLRTSQGQIVNVYDSEGRWVERRVLSSDISQREIYREILNANFEVSRMVFSDGRERDIETALELLRTRPEAADFARRAFSIALDFTKPLEARDELISLALHSDLFDAFYREPLEDRFETVLRLQRIAAGVPRLFSELMGIPEEGQNLSYKPYVETLLRLINTTHFNLEEPFPPSYDSAARPTRYFFHPDGYLQRTVSGYPNLTNTREYNSKGELIRIDSYNLADVVRAVRA
nr:S8 family serine peptidase [Candidatus Omnitrophota bacterium]